MNITIKEQEIKFKRSFRSYIIYESITGKVFAPKNMTDMITYMYSIIMASSKDLEFTYDEYLDWLDENPNAIVEFSTWLASLNDIEDQFNKAEKKSVKKTKKAATKQ